MSSHTTSFNELINRELESRFDAFCNGNSGCDGFCEVDQEIRAYHEANCLDDEDSEEYLALKQQCENCMVRKFIELNKEIK